MLRTLGVALLAGAGIAVVALGGHLGPIDLTGIPVSLLAFSGATAVVLIGVYSL